MKKSILVLISLMALGTACFGQEAFLFSNPRAPAETGSILDPLAGLEPVLFTSPSQEPANSPSLDCTIGFFVFSNIPVPTRLGSADGPLAGPGIWAQMLLGESPDSLVPVGSSKEHLRDGWVVGDYIRVAGGANTRPYVQMLAWDGAAWGTDLAGVPADQFGETDAAQVLLVSVCSTVSPQAPPFTQPAIVPPIPEPSTWMLGLMGASLLVWRVFGRARHKSC